MDILIAVPAQSYSALSSDETALLMNEEGRKGGSVNFDEIL
jgi:hypothetical protein